jgi:RHS repeat-associated protein
LARAGSNTAVYGANQLSVTIVKDENWVSGRAGTSEEYKDKTGRVVLKRTFNYKSGVLEMLSTYYVYDDKGQLAFVLPPGANPDAAAAISSATLNSFCYQYRYDERGRLLEKKLPGKGWDFVVYNKLDQVVATQDSMQRVANRWIFTKYDALGRTVLTGIWDNSNTAISRGALQSSLNSQTVLWEAAVSTGNGYTSAAWPASWTTTLTLNYYDNYNFSAHAYGPWMAGTMAAPKGMLTGAIVAVLQPDGTVGDQLLTEYQYDDKGRIAQTSKQHYLGGHGSYSTGNYDVSIPTYDFNDQVTSDRRTHAVNNVITLVTENAYVYDHAGRRTKNLEAIKAGSTQLPTVMISRSDYNQLGQLYYKRLHSTDWGGTFLQSVDYAYNERGWLTTANSSGNLFNMELKYNTASNPQYNGNIGQMLYTGVNSGSKTFTYGYDKLNRLLSAGSTGGTLDEALVYDVMGNISSLTRGGQAYGALSYTYSGNQLSGVTGTSFTTRSYAYDGNGNATSDGGSKSIAYNLLNLPRKVSNGSTELANYTYDAAGNKLSNVSTSAGANDGTWEYDNGIVYHNSSVAFIATEEGRAVPNSSGGYTYQYNLKDHLGNDRVSFYSNSGVATVLQEDEYYSFGLRRGLYDNSNNNRYLYNGKEIQTDLANQYDYGARFYDPVIGRWTSVDPLVEMGQESTSPFGYVFDNPMKYTDPDGRVPDITIDGANNSSVTIKTDLIDVRVDASSLGVDFGGNYTIQGDEILGAALDIVGIFDPTPISDGLSAGLSAKKGDWFSAGISVLGMIPYAGDLAKAGKIEKDVKIVSNAIDEVKSAKQLLKEGRAGKQEKLAELMTDPKLGKADKGWLKQEKNAVDAGKRTNMRNPPGKDLAHERGREASKGYSYKHSKLQNKADHRTQHKYDNNGKRNKERPL